jgi:hypothetical protein
VTSLAIPHPQALWSCVATLEESLAGEGRPEVEEAARQLARGITQMLEVPPVVVQVLAVRPTLPQAELHGLYTREVEGPPRIQVWMRTAKKKRVVAFRTFLRTLLHELTHHLDYEQLRLADSFHTEGFFKRESSLFHQLVPGDPPSGAPG